MLSSNGGRAHADKRIKAALKAYYGLQGTGLHLDGVVPSVGAKIYSVGVQTVLMYGYESVHLSTKCLKAIERIYARKNCEILPRVEENLANLSSYRRAQS